MQQAEARVFSVASETEPRLSPAQKKKKNTSMSVGDEKLSVLICSLGPEDKLDHGDGGCLPRSPWSQVAPEGGGQTADAALHRASRPPNVPDAGRPDVLPPE